LQEEESMTRQSGRTSKRKAEPTDHQTGPAPLSPENHETVLRDLHRVLENRKFESVEDANAFLATLTGEGLQDALHGIEPPDPRWQAQELAFDAREATTAERARELAQRALALDPDCVDALVVMTDLEATTAREAIAGLKKAVEAGERSLGAEFFRQSKGDFWGILETRPYMRAKAQLAELLRADGSGVQALRHYEGMLELNPNDNQGIRYPLLGCYLAHGRLLDATRLLHDYRGDIMATFAWGRVLERFLTGDRKGAAKALKLARKGNPFMEQFFSGTMPIPKEMPDSYSLGSVEEAMICFDQLGAAWVKNQHAMFWMMDRLYSGTALR